MDKKLIGLIAVFLLLFGSFLSFTFFQSAGSTIRATACDASADKSLLFAWPIQITAGQQTSATTVFARDRDGNPCSDKSVTVTATLGSLEPQVSPTDDNGEARFVFSCPTQGTSTLQATIDGTTSVVQTVSIECI